VQGVTCNLFSTQGSKQTPPAFSYTPLFQHDPSTPSDDTEYKQILPADSISSMNLNGREFLHVPGEAMRTLSSTAFGDVAHLLRPKHLSQLRSILDDTEASDNDRFVALELLKNANIASARVLPGCQDTGTGKTYDSTFNLVIIHLCTYRLFSLFV